MSEFEQERVLYEGQVEESEKGEITETGNKLHDIDSLLECAASDLDCIELELRTVHDWHVEYEAAVKDWLVWFDEAKNKLNVCQVEEADSENIDRKDSIIQV